MKDNLAHTWSGPPFTGPTAFSVSCSCAPRASLSSLGTNGWLCADANEASKLSTLWVERTVKRGVKCVEPGAMQCCSRTHLPVTSRP